MDAVCHVIARRGWENVRFSDVANYANISVGSLQYLFGSREDMMSAALQHRTREIFERVERESQLISDSVQRLRWIATNLLSGTPSEAAGADVEWLIWTEYWRAAIRNDDLRLRADHAYRDWITLASRAITQCIDEGVARTTADPQSIATNLVALGDGLGVQMSIAQSRLPWADAGKLIRGWLAEALDQPGLR